MSLRAYCNQQFVAQHTARCSLPTSHSKPVNQNFALGFNAGGALSTTRALKAACIFDNLLAKKTTN
jgi:hypothetical protein